MSRVVNQEEEATGSVTVKRRHSVFDAQNFGQGAQK